MNYPIYQVDAFTQACFGGNPAAVMPLSEWLPDDTMQSLAMENNLAETAFFVASEGEEDFHLRWFTPNNEIDLCGHATLASAYVIFNELQWPNDSISFITQSGRLEVTRSTRGLTLNFPARPPEAAEVPEGLLKALGVTQVKYSGRARDWLIELENEAEVQALKPDFSEFKLHSDRALIACAKGDKVDFVSRFFAPEYGIDEDPVTGSAHCTSVPYWAEKLGKNTLQAKQLSDRGGDLFCQLEGERVFMSGHCVLFMKGQVYLD
jgi:PhzF family phenazine biosynthesis protein